MLFPDINDQYVINKMLLLYYTFDVYVLSLIYKILKWEVDIQLTF